MSMIKRMETQTGAFTFISNYEKHLADQLKALQTRSKLNKAMDAEMNLEMERLIRYVDECRQLLQILVMECPEENFKQVQGRLQALLNNQIHPLSAEASVNPHIAITYLDDETR